MKYSEISLTKYLQDLYTEKYKTLLRKILKDPNKSSNIPCLWIG